MNEALTLDEAAQDLADNIARRCIEIFCKRVVSGATDWYDTARHNGGPIVRYAIDYIRLREGHLAYRMRRCTAFPALVTFEEVA